MSPTPFTDILNRMTPCIRWHARRLAPDDLDLQEDLKQEGRIALWRLDPVRLAAARHADGYRRSAIRFRMQRYVVAQRRQVPGDRAITWDVVEQVMEELGDRAAYCRCRAGGLPAAGLVAAGWYRRSAVWRGCDAVND